MRAAWATAVPDVVRRVRQRAGAWTWRRYSRTQSTRTVILGAIIGLLFVQMSVGASAFSPSEHPSFSLKVFGYDAVIFYRPQVGQGGLSTSISTNRRHEVRVNPSNAADIQKRVMQADEIQLVYDLQSTGPGAIDLLSKIPSLKPFFVLVSVQFQRTNAIAEAVDAKIMSALEQLSDDPDRSHFDEQGYRLLERPAPNLVMQRTLYRRPDGRPLTFFRHIVSDHVFTLTGSFLLGKRARVDYSFRTDQIAKDHWAEIDKAVFAFVSTVIIRPGQP